MTLPVYQSPVCKLVVYDAPQVPLCQSQMTGIGQIGGFQPYDQYEGGME
ncbi:MAG: hypothetical protein IJU13_03375 [Bacteroidales bacterium]|nr:hypothetical protein [Bacteroidales bacterium]